MAHSKTTSKRIASKAAKTLRSARATKTQKAIAASALSQRHRSGGRKKR